MKAPFYIISDNHFMMKDTSSERDRREKLFKVFDIIKSSGNGTLIIGGDFFDFWFETKTVVPNGYQNLIEKLKELTKSGIEIHYLAGNHDYWDFGYLNRTTNLNFHKGDLQFSHNNRNILVTHGDGLLKNDYGYRFMKKIIRSNLFITLFQMIPPQISFKIANNISKSSSHYNHNDKFIKQIHSDILDFAEQQWLNNIDIVMVGHYHQQTIINKGSNSLVFLGDWLSKFSVTTLISDKLWQGDATEFIKLA